MCGVGVFVLQRGATSSWDELRAALRCSSGVSATCLDQLLEDVVGLCVMLERLQNSHNVRAGVTQLEETLHVILLALHVCVPGCVLRCVRVCLLCVLFLVAHVFCVWVGGRVVLYCLDGGIRLWSALVSTVCGTSVCEEAGSLWVNTERSDNVRGFYTPFQFQSSCKHLSLLLHTQTHTGSIFNKHQQDVIRPQKKGRRFA